MCCEQITHPSNIEIHVGKELDEAGDDTSLDHLLDLLLIADRDPANDLASLLANLLMRRSEHATKPGQPVGKD